MSTAIKPKHIGRNISRIRELRGIKQELLAEAMGISQQSVSNIEAKEMVDKETLIEIAKALGVTVEAIENFSEEGIINYFNTFHEAVSGSFVTNNEAVSDSFITNNSCSFNPLDKVIELYERLVQAEKELVQAEKAKIEYLEKLLNK